MMEGVLGGVKIRVLWMGEAGAGVVRWQNVRALGVRGEFSYSIVEASLVSSE